MSYPDESKKHVLPEEKPAVHLDIQEGSDWQREGIIWLGLFLLVVLVLPIVWTVIF
jgi:cytochrome b